jgi:hypothetical protein
MALFSMPEEARPLWTLWQVPQARGSQDDEDKWQCEGCDEYVPARDHSPRYRLQAISEEAGRPHDRYLCSECAQRQVIEDWLHGALPQTRPVAQATFSGATLWRGTNAEGASVDVVVVQAAPPPKW